MTKDEIKDRISLALKDPILQQWFIDNLISLENENAELEKENKELKTVKIPQLERKIASIRGAHSVDCKKLNARTEQVERLKKQVSAMSKALVNVVSESDGIKDRLSKAKEIIKKLINACCSYGATGRATAEAEQFLKEVSE